MSEPVVSVKPDAVVPDMAQAQLVIQFSTARPTGWWSRWRWSRWMFWWLDMSRWIRRLSHSPFSHVDIVLPDGSLLGASNNPAASVIKGNPCGVAVRPADYQSFGIRRNCIIPTDKAGAIIDYAMSQLGKPFDSEYTSPRFFLSDQFNDRDWRSDDRWACAEMLIRGCEMSGLFPWQLIGIKNRITPSDALLILNPLMDVDRFWEPVVGMKRGAWEL